MVSSNASRPTRLWVAFGKNYARKPWQPYSSGALEYFSYGFPYFVASAFSTPAFSTPAFSAPPPRSPCQMPNIARTSRRVEWSTLSKFRSFKQIQAYLKLAFTYCISILTIRWDRRFHLTDIDDEDSNRSWTSLIIWPLSIQRLDAWCCRSFAKILIPLLSFGTNNIDSTTILKYTFVISLHNVNAINHWARPIAATLCL